MDVSTHSTIHKRMKTFVAWIAPEDSTEEIIKKQAEDIRNKIKPKAEAHGLTVASMPYSGSFAKKTGLRRHLLGNSEVEGQDVDIAFILEAKDKSGREFGCQIHNFRRWLEETYYNSKVGTTKSSATIAFVGTKLSFDLVPLIKTANPNVHRLIRTTGELWQSSVEKQVEFVTKRNRSSNAIEGVVHYNQCLRLIKWWRYQQQANSHILTNDGDRCVPSFLLDLLCAKAYDECAVKKTYAETLAIWFGYLANAVDERKMIYFRDFTSQVPQQGMAKWVVADPVDPTNNVVRNWEPQHINELATWLKTAKAKMIQAIRYDAEKNDTGSMNCLVDLFGAAFKNNCGV